MVDRDPRERLRAASTCLNSTKLDTVLGFLSALSTLEALGENPLSFQTVQLDHLRLMAWASLMSRAASYKSGWFTPDGFIEFRNIINDAMAGTKELSELAHEPDGALTWFSWLAEIQFRPQELDFPEKAGRFLGMYEGVAASKLGSLPAARQELVTGALADARRQVGLSPRDIVAAGYAVFALLKSRADVLRANAPSMSLAESVETTEWKKRLQRLLLNTMVTYGGHLASMFIFRIGDLPRVIGEDPLKRFVDLFSRDIAELRESLLLERHQVGPASGWL